MPSPSSLFGSSHLSLICKMGSKFPQLSVLNKAYSPANISFRLLGPTYTINDSWATDPESQAMKSTLRRGGYSALNLYFQTNLTSPSAPPRNSPNILLGSCTLPTTVTYVPNFCPSPPLPRLALQFHSLLLSIRLRDAVSARPLCQADSFGVTIKKERPFTK